MIRVNQIKVPVDSTEDILLKKIQNTVHSKKVTIERVIKKSIDARDKDNLLYIYAVDISSPDEVSILSRNKNNNNIMSTNDRKYNFPILNNANKSAKAISDNKESVRPIIVGAGPAGYFCGLYLARAGFYPIILERGKCVEDRTKDVESFWNGNVINKESNVSFGEGGAGTFSDGKLNTGIKDKEGRIGAVIADFIKFGAPEDISYLAKPHIGTNELKKVMANMRKEIVSLGGEIRFETRFEAYEKSEDSSEIVIKATDLKTGKLLELKTDSLILALGHSARDTFRKLANTKLVMEPKSFAVGLRIEHKQVSINEAQYGTSEAAKKLPAADYKMTYRSTKGRSVYSFCMCPGGFVVNASSDEEQSVVNGMSNHARDEENANSAIVVNVTPEDFVSEGFGDYGVLAGMEFQIAYEKKTFEEGKGKIPVQRFGDYESGIVTEKYGEVMPNIKGEYTFANLNNCLPPYINDAIIEGIHYYDSHLRGFANPDAMLSGIETRTSSPVRITRDEGLMSNVTGIFPCGEGAGYAGGITSAAVDGIKVAEACAKYLIDKK